LTGVEVQPHGREILTKLYEKILADAKAATADEPSNPYIEYLESAYLPRLQILRETKSILEIEDKMGDGQIEEMIMDAEAELSLIPQMARDRPWNTKKWHSVPVLHSKIDE
jgi:NADH dehydrogenase (ubiquinone) 1 alpha subcomplex subunit 5